MGRPDKLTQEVHDKIVGAIKAGNYIETAAAFAGISKSTLYKWLREGARAKSGKKKEFSHAVAQALAESEVGDVVLIGRAAKEKNDWRAAAWRLEHKFAHWKSTSEVTLKGDKKNPLEVSNNAEKKPDYSNLSNEELELLEKLTLKLNTDKADSESDDILEIE